MKVVAFVPIKFNSVRLPNKNFLPLHNKPLCWHIFNILQHVSNIDEIYVYCSNENIKKYIPDNIIFLKRSKHLDKDHIIGIDIYKSFVSKISADIYILCHATSPYIKSESIQKGLNSVLYNDHDSSFSVKEIKTFCWYKDQPLNYKLNHIPKTQDIESIYYETSAFYIFKKNVIQNNTRIGMNPKLINTNNIESIDIDYLDDYILAKNIDYTTCITNTGQ